MRAAYARVDRLPDRRDDSERYLRGDGMPADAVKVAVITGQLDQGGSERQLYLWLAGLDRSEFDPVVLNLHPGATAYWQEHIAALDVRVIDVSRQFNRGMRMLRVAQAVRKLRPQLVHSWHLHTNWYAAVAARASGARALGSCRGSPSAFRSAGGAAALPALNGIVANSAETVEALRHADFFGRPAFHVRNGLVDWEHDRVGARRRAGALGLDTDAVLIAVLGRVVKEKGLDDLVGVASRVLEAASHPVQFAVIGEGRDRERLEEEARNAGLGTAVRFVGPVADAAQMLDGFDLLCHLSGDEGLPNAPLEASAASIPVVTWDLPYAREMLSTECSTFAKRGDIAGLGREIVRLTDQPDLRLQLGAAARRHVLAQFSLSQMVDAMSDAYRHVLRPPSSALHATDSPDAKSTVHPPRVAYVTSRFPSTTMTFVTNEMLGVRAAGVSVSVATVWPPEPKTLVHTADLEFVNRRVDLSLRNFSVWWAALRHGVAAAHVGKAVMELFPGHAKSPFLLLKLAASIPKGLALARWSTLHGVSWLHAHFLTSPTTVALIASAGTGIPYSSTGHAFDLYDRSWKTGNGSLDVKCRRAAFVVQISDYNERFLNSSMRTGDAWRFVRINNGIDPSVFEAADRSTPRDPSCPLRVVSVGSLVPKKGHDTLIRAASRVARERPVTLTIVGEGPEHRALEELISELRGDSIMTIRPPMEQREVASLLREADVFALACRPTKSGDIDGVPTVILEAMASALPVVSTEVSGVPEAVEDRVTGLLTAPDDAESLAASLTYLAEHPDIGRALGQAGHERVLADFDCWRNGRLLSELWAEHGVAKDAR